MWQTKDILGIGHRKASQGETRWRDGRIMYSGLYRYETIFWYAYILRARPPKTPNWTRNPAEEMVVLCIRVCIGTRQFSDTLTFYARDPQKRQIELETLSSGMVSPDLKVLDLSRSQVT